MPLSLTIPVGESFIVGTGPDAATVTVTQAYGGRAVVSIVAPRHVPVDRKSVRKIKERMMEARAES